VNSLGDDKRLFGVFRLVVAFMCSIILSNQGIAMDNNIAFLYVAPFHLPNTYAQLLPSQDSVTSCPTPGADISSWHIQIVYI
jgi:hypothetical protein